MFVAHVIGMSCSHCVRAVTKAIQHYDPAAVVQVDLPQKQITVTGALSEQQLRTAIGEAGFEPASIAVC